jgi:hypothetical protein
MWCYETRLIWSHAMKYRFKNRSGQMVLEVLEFKIYFLIKKDKLKQQVRKVK